MADKLKIYACSGVGDVQTQAENSIKDVTYWTDNTNTASNTQAVNTLLNLINSNFTEIEFLDGLTRQEKIERFNDIDLWTVAINAAEMFKNDPAALHHAGEVIGMMIDQGDFSLDSLNTQERDEHLDQLLNEADGYYASKLDISTPNVNFMAFWKEYVEDRNKVGLSEKQQQLVAEALRSIDGIGVVDESWKENPELAKYLIKGSEAFIYMYFTPEQLEQLPTIFYKRRQKQIKIYNYCKTYFVGVYGSEAEMNEIIRNGIIQYFHHTPEEVCAKIIDGDIKVNGVEPISWTVEAIIAIVTAVISAVVTIVKAICDAIARAKEAKYGAVTQSDINAAVPNASDFDDIEGGGLDVSTGGGLGIVPIIAIGAAVIYFVGRR